MNRVMRILGILLIVLSAVLLIVIPPAGIIGLIFGILLVIRSKKGLLNKINNGLEKVKEKSEQRAEILNHKAEEARQKTENLKQAVSNIKNLQTGKAAKFEREILDDSEEGIKYDKQSTKINSVMQSGHQIEVFKIQNFVIHDDIKNLLWIADGRYRNYTPEQKVPDFEYYGMKLFVTLGSDEEPSLIYSKYPIQKPQDESLIPRPPYYPTYSGLTPEQRYIYAKLLTDPYNMEIDIGYVFILYYGLERHLFCGDFDSAFKVILKLRDVHKNGSFQSYSANALILTSMLHNRGEYALEFIASLDKEYEFNFMSNLFLICYYSFNLPLTPKDIMRISTTFNFTNRNYIKKNPDIFEKCLSDIIVDEYHSDGGIPLNTFITKTELSKIKMDNWRIFANMSLLDKEIPVPMISEDSKLKKAMYDLLTEAHERTKKTLAEMRKKK